jgi:hypothetical protein
LELGTGEETASDEINENSDPGDIEAYVDNVAQIENGDSLIAVTDSLKDEMDGVELNDSNLILLIQKSHGYLLNRDLYFKNVYSTINKIQSIKSDVIRKMAINALESQFLTNKESDRVIEQKIEKILTYYNDNKTNMDSQFKTPLFDMLKSLVDKYYASKSVIVDIRSKIKSIKETAMKNEIQALKTKIKDYINENKNKEAEAVLRTIVESGIADEDTIKDFGNVLKQVYGEGPKVIVDGKEPTFDVKPTIKEGRTLVPLRAIATALNATNISWDQNTRKITIVKGDKTIELIIGDNKPKVNGQEIIIDVPAQIVEGRTLVPARFVSEALDAAVSFDTETGLITINDKFDIQVSGLAEKLLTGAGLGSTQTTNSSIIGAVAKVLNINETAINDAVEAVTLKANSLETILADVEAKKVAADE